jgi:hypothetical protein
MSDSGPIWLQFDGESDKAYAAFVEYRRLPAAERSLFAVARRLGYRLSARQLNEREGPSHLRAWASKNHWVHRARAYHAALLAAAVRSVNMSEHIEFEDDGLEGHDMPAVSVHGI